MQMMGQDAKPDRVNTWPRLASSECLIAGSALLLLLAAQWLLSSVILGTNYYGGDGKMIVSAALTAFKFGGYFDVTNLSEISPDESQTGINVRVFPALLQDRREVLTATNTSGNPNAWSRV
jgi:hypothetical protein